MSTREGSATGVPVARKLGLLPGGGVVLVGAPPGWEAELGLPGLSVRRVRWPGTPNGSPPVPNGSPPARPLVGPWPAGTQVAVAFFRDQSQLRSHGPALAEDLPAEGAVWAAWPRRAGGHRSDLTDNVVREVLLPLGLVDVKVAALGNDWSGLKFVWRKELRAGVARRHRAGN